MSKKVNISLVFNIIIFIMVSIATILMFFGICFMDNTLVLADSGIGFLKYYTVDSNILMGITSLMTIIYIIKLRNHSIEKIPNWIYVLKLISTTGVVLTFLVTAIYLAPFVKTGYLSLYQNSNLFFHFLVPVLSFITFIFFEGNNIKFKYTFYGISTMLLYGIIYSLNVLIHFNNENFRLYDLYGFVKGGILSMLIAFLIITVITYGISFSLWFLNKKCMK